MQRQSVKATEFVRNRQESAVLYAARKPRDAACF